MQDFQDHLTIDLSGKTHSAMIAFLKKHGADTSDISRFVEDAITWRIIDRELAFRHADETGEVALFSTPPYEPLSSDALMNS
ncbi:MAG: ribbon-helix-helix domain-containing protein [Alphaproteobacteria bacterium]|nr:ribbon-helix-helix domain-containing protein [Alphaproteobacteria bacterium]